MSAILEDVLAPSLRLVICGTALSPESARLGRYYAGPGNRFWRILAETGLTPRALAPENCRSLLDFGIGLTDIVKDQSGVDANVDFTTATSEGLRKVLRGYRPRLLCFNGKRAARAALQRRSVEYGLQDARLEEVQVFIAPSTSAAAKRWWRAEPWQELAALVRT